MLARSRQSTGKFVIFFFTYTRHMHSIFSPYDGNSYRQAGSLGNFFFLRSSSTLVLTRVGNRAITLKKNSQFYVRQGDVERLIAQGYLQRLG